VGEIRPLIAHTLSFMRRLRHHPLIALFCVLCLLGAQQAAHAHFVGHLGAAAETTAVHSGSDEAPGLEYVCTTCAAFSALSSAPPSQAAAPAASPAANQVHAAVVSRFVPAPAPPPYASRAPPVVS
jgi:hypothetical protein